MSWKATLNRDQHQQLDEIQQVVLDLNLVEEAETWERAQAIPTSVMRDLGARGLYAMQLPTSVGGKQSDAVSFGLLFEQIGAASLSLASIVTVHSMVLDVLSQWGSVDQKDAWLTALATGELMGAFALSEPDIGSDAAHVKTRVTLEGDTYVLNGKKKWISNGTVADWFLVIAQDSDGPTALMVPHCAPGVRVTPMSNLLGFRASNVAEIHFEQCRIPMSNRVGAVGAGFSHVAGRALDLGRFCIAFACLGLIEACTEHAIRYSRRRQQFGQPLIEHQLVSSLISNMITGAKATRHLCIHAARLRDLGDPAMIIETTVAKYFASRTANTVASDAIQVHGAMGCSDQLPLERYYRDARITEIIEGSNEMQQLMIARNGAMAYLSEKRSLAHADSCS